MADNPVQGSGYSENEAAARISAIMGGPEAQPEAPDAATPAANQADNRDPSTGRFKAKEPEVAEDIVEADVTDPAMIEVEDAEIEATEDAPDDTGGSEELPDTFDGLAAALEVDPDELQDYLKAKVKIDGVEQEVSLRELAAGYQKDADYRQKTARLSERGSQLDQRAAQITEVEQKITAEMVPTLQALHGMVNQQVQRVEAMLDSNSPLYNPDGYRDAKRQLDQQLGLIRNASMQAQQTQQRQQAEQHRQQEESLQEAETRLAEMFPAWAENPAKGKADIRMLRDFAHEAYGIPREFADSFYRPEYFQILLDAKAHRDLQAKKPEITKKVMKAPKTLKAGAQKPRVDPNQKRLSANLGKLRKSGGRDMTAAAGAIGALLRR